MKKHYLVITLTLLTCIMFFACHKEYNSLEDINKQNAEDNTDITSISVNANTNIAYLNSSDFQNQLNSIGWTNIQNSGRNIDVISSSNVVLSDPFDLSDVDVNPFDVGLDPIPTVIIRFIVPRGESGPWGGLGPGIYFLDTDTGKVYDMLGNCVRGC